MAFNFAKALVKSPKRSRVDLSCDNYVGIRTGAATPTYLTFVVPSDEISASMEQVARLAPMPVPTFVDLKVRHDWFFVPLRILYSDKIYQQLFDVTSTAVVSKRCSVSMAEICTFDSQDVDQDGGLKECTLPIPGSLWDYLGYPTVSDANINPVTDTRLESAFYAWLSDSTDPQAFQDFQGYLASDGSVVGLPALNLEPWFCYHFIWRDWYRMTGIEPGGVGSALESTYLDNHCLDSYYTDYGSFASNFASSADIGDFIQPEYVVGATNQTVGDVLGRLKYPHFAPDGFTSVRYGSKPVVLIPTGATGDIPHLREASAWQRVVDIFSVAGNRLYDRIKAVFNIEPTGFADDRVQFLARYQSYIKIGEVITTSTTAQAKTGDYAGRGVLIDGNYLFKRRFSEYGWLMCVSSVMPNIAYDGVSRQLTDISLLDTPFPQLAEVGDQTVYEREVNFQFSGDPNVTFGANSFGNQFRYYAYKWMPNTVHGSFKMSTMSPWVPTNKRNVTFNALEWTKAYPEIWNKIFNDTGNEIIFGDRYFFKLSFHVQAVRPLPKYVNYHL